MASKPTDHRARLCLWAVMIISTALGAAWLLIQRTRLQPGTVAQEGGGSPQTVAHDVPGRQEVPQTSENKGVQRATKSSAPSLERDVEGLIAEHRSAVLNSTFGKAAIAEVVHALGETSGGPEVQVLFQVLALRKNEALPLVREKLRTGDMFEKHALTKFLRSCPWPETKSELLELAAKREEQWLPRQGALYALGALGDASAAPEVASILTDAHTPKGIQLVAIATLARVRNPDAASAIRPFLEDEDIHVRLFANRALAELGELVNKDFLLSALSSDDYLVRQEASEALWAVEGLDIAEQLQNVALSDSHEAVQDAARQALLERDLRGRSRIEKLALLRRALEGAERHTTLWILQTALAQCGEEGRAFLGTLAANQDQLGERARTYLILSGK